MNHPHYIVDFRPADLTDEAAEQLFSILEPQHAVAPRLIEWMAGAITWRLTSYEERRETMRITGAGRDPGFAPLSIDLGNWKDAERLQAAVLIHAMIRTLTEPTAVAFAMAIGVTLADHDNTLTQGSSPLTQLAADFAANIRKNSL